MNDLRMKDKLLTPIKANSNRVQKLIRLSRRNMAAKPQNFWCAEFFENYAAFLRMSAIAVEKACRSDE